MQIIIGKSEDPKVFETCAKLMANSEPWITLKRDYKKCLEAFQGDFREIYIAMDNEKLVGFAILQMIGTFKGYIQSIMVVEEYRGKGVGANLLDFCEKRIFQDSPNVFMCVSSFNLEASKLYNKLGYKAVGEFNDFIVKGHSEILLRKTIAALADFNK